MTFTSRHIEHVQQGVATQDGAGVKLTRVLTQNLQMRLDPFLMLDAFGSDQRDDYIAGFPPHPHRGFETVTYMLDGRMRHRDSAGNEGLLGPGGVQWMTAGSGLIHSEMPEQDDGVMEGFQLWVNLPSRLKMTKPDYVGLQAADIPTFTTEGGVTVEPVSGEWLGVKAPIQSLIDIQNQLSEQSRTLTPEMWKQFIAMQSPLLQGVMGNYVEQSKNIFIQMQDQLQKQTAQVLGAMGIKRNPN